MWFLCNCNQSVPVIRMLSIYYVCTMQALKVNGIISLIYNSLDGYMVNQQDLFCDVEILV